MHQCGEGRSWNRRSVSVFGAWEVGLLNPLHEQEAETLTMKVAWERAPRSGYSMWDCSPLWAGSSLKHSPLHMETSFLWPLQSALSLFL